ncbi:MAG: hypothetical protein QGD92_13735 [Gammaproteobacteria bacterium]|nr:hypothetical protein [Gammaproteobacteria bacterium]
MVQKALWVIQEGFGQGYLRNVLPVNITQGYRIEVIQDSAGKFDALHALSKKGDGG